MVVPYDGRDVSGGGPMAIGYGRRSGWYGGGLMVAPYDGSAPVAVIAGWAKGLGTLVVVFGAADAAACCMAGDG
jgi:hypothetical protein